jgi:hypothetical protein
MLYNMIVALPDPVDEDLIVEVCIAAPLPYLVVEPVVETEQK